MEMFGSTESDMTVTGGRRKLHNLEHHHLIFSKDNCKNEVDEAGIGKSCSKHENNKNANRGFKVISEGKRSQKRNAE
jgi:hypothetical protein